MTKKSRAPIKRKLFAPKGNPGVQSTVSRIRALNAMARSSTVNLGLGKPSVDMPSSLRALIDDKFLARSMEYADNAGIPALRECFAKEYGFKSEQLLIAHGAQGATTCALLAILKPGDHVLVPDPGFLAYEKTVAMLHGKGVAYALRREGYTWHFDFALMRKAVTRKTKAIFVCSPNNPTGSMISEDLMQEMAAWARKRGIWLLSDEVYGELQFSEPYKPAALLADNIVSLNSLSKSHALTGWRIGWLAAQNTDFVNRTIVANQYKNTSTSTPAQQLTLAMFEQPGLFRRIIREFQAEYSGKMNRLFSALPMAIREECAQPGGSFYAFLPAPKPFRDGDAFAMELMKQHDLLVIPGTVFGKRGKGYVRVSIAAKEAWIDYAAQTFNRYYK